MKKIKVVMYKIKGDEFSKDQIINPEDISYVTKDFGLDSYVVGFYNDSELQITKKDFYQILKEEEKHGKDK